MTIGNAVKKLERAGWTVTHSDRRAPAAWREERCECMES